MRDAAIDSPEALCKTLGITRLATYDTELLAIEVNVGDTGLAQAELCGGANGAVRTRYLHQFAQGINVIHWPAPELNRPILQRASTTRPLL